MSETDTSLAAALLLGFFGSSHCLLMCGGISAALGMGSAPERRLLTVSLFQAGRILTYSLLGAGLGAAIAGITALQSALLPALRIISGLLLVAMGLYVARWWPGLTWLERGGQGLWRRIEPAARRRLPVKHSGDAFVVGMLWGFLPCGLIYTALAWSATTADWRHSALLMLLFGLGTTPAMLATGLAAERIGWLLRQRGFQVLAALLLIAAGAWTAWVGYQHAGHLARGPGAMNGGAEMTEDPHRHH